MLDLEDYRQAKLRIYQWEAAVRNLEDKLTLEKVKIKAKKVVVFC